MIERGNTTHDPEQDEQLAHEAQGLVQGRGGVGHVEEARQTEPLPDDTDSAEVQQAAGLDGELVDVETAVTPEPASTVGDGKDTLTETAAGLSADPVAVSTETPEGADVERAEPDGSDPSAPGQPVTDVAGADARASEGASADGAGS
ncbi:hypothetical protein ABID92_001357 [Frigoribacterium sp. PvP120]|uniref:hypothetical protein n=1 Tax=unclassified Frigoribacterium TaxID=2627005 RepID=UPI001AE79E48|nr:hypothetical protein [Frigoribacterium sp. PvP121]MBP1240826.1 hypothetical protein [Frigoribacterium sp. PvP121]